MTRGLSCGLLFLSVALLALGHAQAATRDDGAPMCPALQRFLAIDDPSPSQYRALRHLDAHSERLDSSAWMDVWTEADAAAGFRYRIAAEGGSESIRRRVFRATLETEKNLWATGEPDRSALTPANYVFQDRGSEDGLATLGVKPKRKDMLLVDGAIFLRPEDGDLVRVEGALAKPPSFWTRRVEIVRQYRRVNGIRMPVVLEGVASVLIAGRSTFRMTYEYESINGQPVGPVQVRASSPLPRP
jgi:hypothetical protein